jgi:glycosyltransferase involved in cell wall biosynthesis
MPKKVVIVHDWLLSGGGGAEQVVMALHKMFPEAPIYTSYATDEWRQRMDGKVVTGYLQRWPFSRLRKFLPVLRIWWFTHLDLSGYDLVISSSGNGEAKGIRVPGGTTHICYCHTPTHFYWRHYDQYLKHPGFGVFNPLARLGLRLLVGPLRRWDKKAAQRPDYFIANSNHIKNDIKKYYGREATVIHPPVDVRRFNKAKSVERQGFVTAGRQVPYKHTNIIIEACAELGVPLTVIGRGPQHKALVKQAGRLSSTLFPDDVSDTEMPNYIASAEAFLFAAFEDFGVTPVEAMAAGTPVIAYKAGGVLDYVKPGKTGEFFNQQTAASLAKAIENFRANKFKAVEISKVAQVFSPERFQSELEKFIEKSVKN